MTESFEREESIPLTNFLVDEIEEIEAKESDGLAKILPFKSLEVVNTAERKDSIDEEYEKYAEREKKRELRGIEEAEMKKNGTTASFSGSRVDFDEDEEVEDVIESSIFILAEQRRLKESQNKLKSKQVLNSYRRNAAVSIEQEKEMNEDLNKSADSGILINKRRM